MIGTLEDVYGVQIDDGLKAWFDFLDIFRLDFLALPLIVPSKCIRSMATRRIATGTWSYLMILAVFIGIMMYAFIFDRSISGREIRIWSLRISIVILYIALPSVSESIFDTIKCGSFTTINKGQVASYLVADWSIRCDASVDEEYDSILNIFRLFLVMWPICVPLVFFGFLWSCRKLIRANRPSQFARACDFLWRDYQKNLIFWEVVDIVRKVFLTGFIMFI